MKEPYFSVAIVLVIFIIMPQLYKLLRYGIDSTYFGDFKYRKRKMIWLKNKGFYGWDYHLASMTTIKLLIEWAAKRWENNNEIQKIKDTVLSLDTVSEVYDIDLMLNFFGIVEIINNFPKEEIEEFKKQTPEMIIPVKLSSFYAC